MLSPRALSMVSVIVSGTSCSALLFGKTDIVLFVSFHHLENMPAFFL